MLRFVLPIVGVVGLATGHFSTLELIPRIMMSGAMDRIAAGAGGTNVFSYPPLPDENARRVVRPGPDLAYAACVFDLSLGPLRITAPVPDQYWSLSIFDARTDVVGLIQGEDAAPNAVVWLAGPEHTVPSGERRIDPGSMRGIALIRILVPDRDTYPILRKEVQTRAQCKPSDTL